jgi:hypothetical protein
LFINRLIQTLLRNTHTGLRVNNVQTERIWDASYETGASKRRVWQEHTG